MQVHAPKPRIYATPSNADILLVAVASVKLSQAVLFHKSVHRWLTTRRTAHRAFLPLPCPPTNATFAVDRFLTHAPEGYAKYNPRCGINRLLHRYLSSAVCEVRGQLRCGHVMPVMNLWRFALNECLKRYGKTFSTPLGPLLNVGLCKRLDILVIKLPTKDDGMLISCIQHLISLLTSNCLATPKEERLVATYICVLLPRVIEHLAHHPASPQLEATLRSALRWARAYS